MAAITTAQIRNIALVGPSGSGKTTLIESLLQMSGTISVAGSVEKGTTVCGAGDALEKELGRTLEPWLCHIEHNNLRLHIFDTPGLFDLMGRSIAVLAAVDTVLVVLSATQGLDASAERLFEIIAARGLDCFVVINKIDAPGAKPAQVLAQLQERIGKHCLPINLPAQQGGAVVDCYFSVTTRAVDIGTAQAAHDALIDQVVEVDEALMARYLEQGENLTPEQLHPAFERCLREAHIIPVSFCSTCAQLGLKELLQILEQLAPDPTEGNPVQFLKGEGASAKKISVQADPEAHVIAHVCKVSIDAYVGRVAWLRVHQGTLKSGMNLMVGDSRKPFKLAHLLRVQGKQTREIGTAVPGDIIAISKVDDLHYDAVVHDSHDEDHHHLVAMTLPEPVYGLALKPSRHGDEQKLSDVLHKLAAEDPSLRVEHRAAVNETVLLGLGETHLKVALAKMRLLAQLEIETHPPAVPYKETITAQAEGHYRHKKQSGGAGQFAEVSLRVEPLARGSGFEFVDAVVGGAIPHNFIPSVEKGVREVLQSGAIAGFHMQDIRVVLTDGKHHPVDSKDIAFLVAGRKAFLAAIDAAAPILLEPILDLRIECYAHCVGDLSSDISAKRGVIHGNDVDGSKRNVLNGELPMAELPAFQLRLKAITGGEGRFTMQMSHYAPVPLPTQQQLIGKYRRKEEE